VLHHVVVTYDNSPSTEDDVSFPQDDPVFVELASAHQRNVGFT